jgi:hypothetical protein
MYVVSAQALTGTRPLALALAGGARTVGTPFSRAHWPWAWAAPSAYVSPPPRAPRSPSKQPSSARRISARPGPEAAPDRLPPFLLPSAAETCSRFLARLHRPPLSAAAATTAAALPLLHTALHCTALLHDTTAAAAATASPLRPPASIAPPTRLP